MPEEEEEEECRQHWQTSMATFSTLTMGADVGEVVRFHAGRSASSPTLLLGVLLWKCDITWPVSCRVLNSSRKSALLRPLAVQRHGTTPLLQCDSLHLTTSLTVLLKSKVLSQALSRTPAEAARPRKWGQCIAWYARLLPSFCWYSLTDPIGMARWVDVSTHISHGRDSNPRPRSRKSGTVPHGHHVRVLCYYKILIRVIYATDTSL